MTRNARNLLISLGVVAGTLVGMILIVPSGASVASDVRRSAQRASPDGVAAWARSLDSLDRVTVLRFESFARGAPSANVEVVLDPIVPPTAVEAGMLMAWLRDGGRMVVSPGGGSPLLDSLGLDWRLVFDPDSARIASHPWTEGLGAGEVAMELPTRGPFAFPVRRGFMSSDTSWVPLVELVEPAPEPDTTDAAADSAAAPSADPRAGMGPGGAPDTPTSYAAIALLPVGEGEVLAIGDGAVLSNELLATSPEAVVATRAVLAWTEADDRIGFSEFHQGIRGTGSAAGLAWTRLNGHPVGRVIVWAVVLGGLAILGLGRRFGGVIPQDGDPRRSPMEHVRALAEIYRQAGADRIVADRLVTGAARRAGLDTRLAVEPARALEWWQSHAERREAAERTRAAWERDPPDLRALADALDELVPTTDPS